MNFVKRGISDFFRDYPSRGVRFYGAGEPTMEMPIIIQTVEFVNSLNENNTYFELQSNVFFHRHMVNFDEKVRFFVGHVYRTRI